MQIVVVAVVSLLVFRGDCDGLILDVIVMVQFGCGCYCGGRALWCSI
jgi:hypothetical protein